MGRIVGGTAVSSMLVPDMKQTNPKRADFIKNKHIVAPAIPNTASGTAVAITDISPLEHALGVKVRSKNLVPYPFKIYSSTTQTINGVTFIDNGDGTITVDGTATGSDAVYYIFLNTSNPMKLQKGAYTISGAPSGADYGKYYITSNVITNGAIKDYSIGEGGRTLEIEGIRALGIVVFKGITINNLTFKPQLEIGSATEYTPYVADVSTVTLQSFEKNLYDNSTIANKLDVTAPETSYKKYKIILPNGTYTWSLQENTFFGMGHYLLFTDYKEFDGTPAPTNYISSWIGHNGSESLCQKRDTFEVTRGYVYLSSTAPLDFLTEITDKLSTMQIESGTEATPFEPYKEPTPYPINPNGTVEGVTSLYPTTTLIPDTEGVMIDVEYKADTKKYIDSQIDKKIAELAAMIVNS